MGSINLRISIGFIGFEGLPYNIQSNERMEGKDLHNSRKELHFIERLAQVVS